MTPDPRWLEILKASGWQTASLAAACALWLYAANEGWIPPLEPIMSQVGTLALFIFGFLTIGSIGSALCNAFPVHKWIQRAIALAEARQMVEKYIPHMTAKERQIISYLLERNQKAFTCSMDGGYATTLIAKGIVVRTLRAGHGYDPEDIPMIIPDHVWDVLVKHKDSFPAESRADGGHPWRVSWMAR